VDGTKVQGNASKHKAMSYKYLREKEETLKAEIKEMMQQAQATDAAEDERYGPGKRSEDLPQELKRRESRLAKIRKAKKTLEEEARQARARQLRQEAKRAEERSKTHEDPAQRRSAATAAKNRRKQACDIDGRDDVEDDTDPPATKDGLVKHEPRVNKDGSPHEKAQMNFTDEESRIMESGGNFLQGYNCQAAVDEEHQIIVAQAVSNQSPDNANLNPMLKIEQPRRPRNLSAPKNSCRAGFWPNQGSTRLSEILTAGP
jgi:hypothetical protein